MTIQNGLLKPSGVIQLRGGSFDAMTEANPLLARREIAVETDTSKIKVGDGSTLWNDLPYSGSNTSATGETLACSPILDISLDNVILQAPAMSKIVTLKTTSDGTISIESDNSDIAVASLDGSNISIRSVAQGNTIIRIHIAASTLYSPITNFIHVTVLNGFRYGYRINKNEPDPYNRVEYLYDAVGMTPAHMDFDNEVFDYGDWENVWFVSDNKPCMLKSNGTVDYYLDSHDYSKKDDGFTPSDVSNSDYDGNAMVQFPLCWVYRYEDKNYEYEIVSNIQWDDNYKAYAHTRADGSIAQFFYWSLFGGSIIDSKIRSIADIPRSMHTTRQQEIDAASANGDLWFTHTWSMRELIRTLLVLIGKSTNTQAVFGNGRAVASNETLTTGTLKDKGQFFGYTSNVLQVKVFHIEAFWGDVWDATAGFIVRNGTAFVKMTPQGRGYRISDVIGYTDTKINLPTSGFISSVQCSELGSIPISVSNGSTSSFYSDLITGTPSELKYTLCGGASSDQTHDIGAYTFHFGEAPTGTHSVYGCGLSCQMPLRES